MRRLLLCLSLGFVVIPETPPQTPPSQGATVFADVSDDGTRLPDTAEMERLAKNEPREFLKKCLLRYDREIKGYQTDLKKQERLGGKLQPSELIAVKFREEPFSVLLDWRKGAGLAQRVLFVKGKYNDKLLVRPRGLASLAGVVERDPYGPEAKRSARYPLPEFGIKVGMQRALASWDRAAKQNALHIEYLGIRRIKELDNRPCFVLKRTGYRQPEEDGITDFTTYIDRETWLQVGSVLKGAEGQLIGEYYFRNLQPNPPFPPGTFSRQNLNK